MLALGILALVFACITIFIFPFWAYSRIRNLEHSIDQLRQDLATAREAKERGTVPKEAPPQPVSVRQTSGTDDAAASQGEPDTSSITGTDPRVRQNQNEGSVPHSASTDSYADPVPEVPALPLQPIVNVKEKEPLMGSVPVESVSVPADPTTPPPPPIPALPTATVPAKTRPALNWEQFMGVKLFAWLGGFAAFLGVAFGIKYSFEHDLIPKEVRAALGFVFSFGLVVLGLRLLKSRYKVTAQTLCATGVVSLYAVTFACHAIYDFPAFSSSSPFGVFLTFGLMALITTSAFIIAVRTDAQVVAILGILGGFLTPALISTGHDNPAGLFGYIGLLNAGLVAVALSKRWGHLAILGAIGTVLIQVGWAFSFLRASNGNTAVFQGLAMQAEFVGLYFIARRLRPELQSAGVAAWIVTWSALVFCLVVISSSDQSQNPVWLFTTLFAIDALASSMMWRNIAFSRWSPLVGGTVFVILCLWTGDHVTQGNLPLAGGAFLLFAVVHTVFPLLLAKKNPGHKEHPLFQFFPALGVVLMIMPSLDRGLFSFIVWPVILVLNLLSFATAAIAGTLLGCLIVLALTFFAAARWISGVESSAVDFGALALIIGGFACLFFAAGFWLLKRVPALAERFESEWLQVNLSPKLLPIFSGLLPYILTLVAAARLALPEAQVLFGLMLVLNVLCLGTSKVFKSEWIPLCAVVGTAATVQAWVIRNPTGGEISPLVWLISFNVLFATFPFVFRRSLEQERGPWIAAAVAGLSLFTSTLQLCTRHHLVAIGAEGIIPAILTIVPIIQLVVELRSPLTSPGGRLFRLALFGGAALAFITLVFPVQFSRQYLTMGWALEGAALCWLFRRVPHRGLPVVGVLLLATSLFRLLLNPAVLSYHPAGLHPIFNWYLAAYGITATSLFTAATLLSEPQAVLLGIPIKPWLRGGAVALLFLLLNIEIADYFSPANSVTLLFEFSGNFARDMTYTIAWAVFAFLLLSGGVWLQSKVARYVALALLGLSVMKLFFHDLANLGALYRIGALFGVAIIAMLASMVYQRFLSPNEKNT